MLADLKILEDKLYQPEALNAFISVCEILCRNTRSTM